MCPSDPHAVTTNRVTTETVGLAGDQTARKRKLGFPNPVRTPRTVRRVDLRAEHAWGGEARTNRGANTCRTIYGLTPSNASALLHGAGCRVDSLNCIYHEVRLIQMNHVVAFLCQNQLTFCR